jgi:C-terminal processing protease CtpA/Prc
VAARYTHTEHGTTSVTTPVTTYHTKTRIIGFDREGRAIKKRTTQETTAYYTDWIPYSSDQYAVNALFLFRKNFVFGAQVAVVPPEVSAKVGKNGGVQILALVRGAPAYKADLFEGDVILAVDGEKLESADMKAQFEEILQRSAGKTISLEIWRNGETVKKSVSLAGGQPDVHSINEA